MDRQKDIANKLNQIWNTLKYGGSSEALTLSSVAVTDAASVQLLKARESRIAANIYNAGNDSIYLKIGTAASASSYTLVLATSGNYSVPREFLRYNIHAICAAGQTATIIVTES